MKQLLHQFVAIVRINDRVIDLGTPYQYLFWTITWANDDPVHAAQPTLIFKEGS